MENKLKEALVLLGYDSDLDKVRESFVHNMQELHKEISALKEKLGQGITAENAYQYFSQFQTDFKKFLKSINLRANTIEECFKSHWDGMYYEGSISCSIDEDEYFSDSAENPEDKIKNDSPEKYLRRRLSYCNRKGIMLHKQKGGGGYYNLLDCPENRKWLISEVKEKYPNAQILEFINCSCEDGESYMLRHVKIRIKL